MDVLTAGPAGRSSRRPAVGLAGASTSHGVSVIGRAAAHCDPGAAVDLRSELDTRTRTRATSARSVTSPGSGRAPALSPHSPLSEPECEPWTMSRSNRW